MLRTFLFRVIVSLACVLFGVALGVWVGGMRFRQIPQTYADPEASAGVKEALEEYEAQYAPAPLPVAKGSAFADFSSTPLQPGDSFVSKFSIINSGEAPLLLEKGAFSPECLEWSLSQNTLAPGEIAVVELRCAAPSVAGTFDIKATLYTNDPKRSQVVFRTKGRVDSNVSVETSQLSLGLCPINQTKTISTRLLSKLNVPPEVASVRFLNEASAPFFEVAFENIDPTMVPLGAKSALRMILSVKPGLPKGPFRQTVELTTKAPEERVLRLHLEGYSEDDLSLSGSGWTPADHVLVLGGVRRGKSIESRLTLQQSGNNFNDVFAVGEVQPAFLLAEIGELDVDPTRGTSKQALVVTLPKDAPRGTFWSEEPEKNGRIVLKSPTTGRELVFYVKFSVF
ncbi:MAG: DUF1573 domain-containing protein [Planctomycetia bacterium]|nr:DUF1573 domain-containing protein [Planctomycetia bacterium]